MKYIECEYCTGDNHPDNFICEHCGFDLDLTMGKDENGLPIIKIKE